MGGAVLYSRGFPSTIHRFLTVPKTFTEVPPAQTIHNNSGISSNWFHYAYWLLQSVQKQWWVKLSVHEFECFQCNMNQGSGTRPCCWQWLSFLIVTKSQENKTKQKADSLKSVLDEAVNGAHFISSPR